MELRSKGYGYGKDSYGKGHDSQAKVKYGYKYNIEDNYKGGYGHGYGKGYPLLTRTLQYYINCINSLRSKRAYGQHLLVTGPGLQPKH